MYDLDSTIARGLVQEWTQYYVSPRGPDMSGQIKYYALLESTYVWKLNLMVDIS